MIVIERQLVKNVAIKVTNWLVLVARVVATNGDVQNVVIHF